MDPAKEAVWASIVERIPLLLSDEPDLVVFREGIRDVFEFSFDAGARLGFAAGRLDARLGTCLEGLMAGEEGGN